MKPEFTPEQKIRIYNVIHARMLRDDPYPHEIIAKEYGGDENAYLMKMAEYHRIEL